MEFLGTIIAWAIFGIIVGAIARLLMPGRQELTLGMTMLLGIVGSVAGGLVSWIFTRGPTEPFQPSGWLLSIMGAIIVLWAYTASKNRGRTTPTSTLP